VGRLSSWPSPQRIKLVAIKKRTSLHKESTITTSKKFLNSDLKFCLESDLSLIHLWNPPSHFDPFVANIVFISESSIVDAIKLFLRHKLERLHA
jgi:hypothetical protein